MYIPTAKVPKTRGGVGKIENRAGEIENHTPVRNWGALTVHYILSAQDLLYGLPTPFESTFVPLEFPAPGGGGATVFSSNGGGMYRDKKNDTWYYLKETSVRALQRRFTAASVRKVSLT